MTTAQLTINVWTRIFLNAKPNQRRRNGPSEMCATYETELDLSRPQFDIVTEHVVHCWEKEEKKWSHNFGFVH